MDTYQNFIALSKYARWCPETGRRERFSETVNRYISFFKSHLKKNCGFDLDDDLVAKIFQKINDFEIMPSMRAMMTAGEALERDHIAGYNCAYTSISRKDIFSEILYILMCGTGVGFSVERQYIRDLPEIPKVLKKIDEIHIVDDSKLGWAVALRAHIDNLYDGKIISFDYSLLRPAGSILRVMGGRSSGPKPFIRLIQQIQEVFTNAKGRKLNSEECHDLCCYIADAVVVGGVRRSALISLSNLSDMRMRDCKSGDWWNSNPQRALANNSTCYTEKPAMPIFIEELLHLIKNKSGERGIFNREGAKKHVVKNARRDSNYEFGCNPCSEIILRSNEFCNLSEIIARKDDTIETLCEKVKYATIIGTFQATLTDFKFISPEWKKNCEEERLLGVSITGIMDCPLLNKNDDYLIELLVRLKEITVETNKIWAAKLGINQATATTCVKPSGTVSQLVDAASGIHPRYSEYYIRTVRSSKMDPMTTFMLDNNIPHEDDLNCCNNIIFQFPIKSPSGCITRDDLSALDHLKFWATYQRFWCEHKPSVTITVKDDEWLEVGAWVYANFDDVSGISFLPYDIGIYKQAPYQKCDKNEYITLSQNVPKNIEWDDLGKYEKDDHTTATREYACIGDKCEFV
ncbi:MAG: ribonucleoside-triphosphate reductase [Candidatus Aenigmarchaeota archaeon]|nr:ribonucleoside-triphosphate reductase [Candidatus Aenigmarchaeota archaeon]